MADTAIKPQFFPHQSSLCDVRCDDEISSLQFFGLSRRWRVREKRWNAKRNGFFSKKMKIAFFRVENRFIKTSKLRPSHILIITLLSFASASSSSCLQFCQNNNFGLDFCVCLSYIGYISYTHPNVGVEFIWAWKLKVVCLRFRPHQSRTRTRRHRRLSHMWGGSHSKKKGSIKLHKLHISLSLHPNQSNIIFPKCFLQFFEFFIHFVVAVVTISRESEQKKCSAQKISSLAPMQTFFVFVSHFSTRRSSARREKEEIFQFSFSLGCHTLSSIGLM